MARTAPRFRYGSFKQCALQGDVKIVGLSNGRIPWPLAIKPGRGGRSFVLYGDLAKAVRREAAIAVAYWWGVRPDTLSRWRKAQGVGRSTRGSHALWSAHTREPWAVAAWKKAHVRSKSPEALAKLAAAIRGKPMPKHVAQAIRRANTGRKSSAETRRKMSESHSGKTGRWGQSDDHGSTRWLHRHTAGHDRGAAGPRQVAAG